MSENDVEYWKHKYALLEEQFLLSKKRNEELEERLLEMAEKSATEEAALREEITELCKKLTTAEEKVCKLEKQCLRFQKDCEALLHLAKLNSQRNEPTSTPSSPQPQTTETPEDPFTNVVSIQTKIFNGTWAKNYEDLDILKMHEGFIYGFK
ncbi:hypothetical protein WR25_05284, partial [Diploscapter pachys]